MVGPQPDANEVRRVNALAAIGDVARRRWTRELSAEEQQRAPGHGPELELIIERPELRPLKGQRVLTVELRVLRGQELLYDDRVNSPNPPLAVRDVDGNPVINELEALRQHLYDVARAATGGFQRPRRERRPDGTFRGDTLSVRSNTTDGGLESHGDTSWSNTQSGSGSLTANTTGTTGDIICSNTSGLANANYAFAVLYMDFDTSSIADAATIDGYTVTLYGTGSAELDTDNQAVQCRAKDWGGSLTTADWINFTVASNWTGLTLVADLDISSWNQTANTANNLTSQGALSAINKTGNTSLVFGTDRMTGSALPTGATHENRIRTYLADQTGTTSDPLLTVTYTTSVAHSAAAALAGVAALTAAGERGVKGATVLSGIGAVAALGTRGALGAATLSGIGAISPSATVTLALTAATLTGIGSLAATASYGAAGATLLAGVGALSPDPTYGASAKAALASVGAFTPRATLVVVVIVPTRQRPRVYVHDGATLYRIAQFTSAVDINRAFSLRDRNRQAQFTVAIDEPQIEWTNPRYGHVIVIESSEYRLPWVGRVIEREGNRGDRTVTVTADQYDAVLAERFLPNEYTTPEVSSEAFRRALARVNGMNPTGIGIGFTERRTMPELSLPNARGSDAFDKIAEAAGMEWWLSYSLDSGRLLVYANLAAERGADYFADVTLTGPNGNFEVQGWRERNNDVYAQTVIGGESSVLEAFTERERSIALNGQRAGIRDDSSALELVVEAQRVLRFGHLLAGETSFREPTTRRERLAVREELKASGVTGEVAEQLLTRRFYPSQVIQGRAYPDELGLWQYLEPGNVLHLVSGDAFVTGYDGPAVIIGAQPMEHDRFVDLVLEVG